MSGLAGLGLATFSDPSVVVITDGNPDAVKSLKVGIPCLVIFKKKNWSALYFTVRCTYFLGYISLAL